MVLDVAQRRPRFDAEPDEIRPPLRANAFADEDGEMVLGMILAGGRAALNLANEAGLRRRDFYRQAHRATYDAIVATPENVPAFLPEDILDHMARERRLREDERPLRYDLEMWRERGALWDLLPGYVLRAQKARRERLLEQVMARAQAKIDAGDVDGALGLLGEANSYCLVSPGESVIQDNTKLSPGRLPFAPLSKSLENVAEAPDPLVGAMGIHPRATIGLSAREKIGKTTIMFGLFKALENGDPFLGLPTRKAGVLLLTEENPDTIAEKQETWGIGDHVHILYRHQAEDTPFKEVMAQARAYCLENDLAGIVVDTFFEWSGLAGEEENQSGSVKAAVQAAKSAIGDSNLFVFLVCHDSKGGPWRGSTVLPAMLDVKLELRVPAGEDADTTTRRILTGKGRYASIPRALLCELTDDGYRAIGEPAPRERTERNRVVTAVAQLGETKWEPVAQKLGLSKPQTLALLRAAVRAGDLSCTGRGVRNDPMVFRAVSPPGSGPDGFVLSCPPPLGGEPNNTSLHAGPPS